MTCRSEYLEAVTTASKVGPVSFGALALLVAFLVGFIELGRDRVVVTRELFRELRWSTALLAGQSIVWVSMEISSEFPTIGGLCVGWLWSLTEIVLYLTLGLAVVLFWRFISSMRNLAESSQWKEKGRK